MDDSSSVDGHVPTYSAHLTGLTGERIDDPTWAVQFAVVDPDGTRTAYGDQSWVAASGPVRDGSHPGGRIQSRTVTITYGEWVDHDCLR